MNLHVMVQLQKSLCLFVIQIPKYVEIGSRFKKLNCQSFFFRQKKAVYELINLQCIFCCFIKLMIFFVKILQKHGHNFLYQRNTENVANEKAKFHQVYYHKDVFQLCASFIALCLIKKNNHWVRVHILYRANIPWVEQLPMKIEKRKSFCFCVAWLITSPQANRPDGRTHDTSGGQSSNGCHQCCQGNLARPWKIL